MPPARTRGSSLTFKHRGMKGGQLLRTGAEGMGVLQANLPEHGGALLSPRGGLEPPGTGSIQWTLTFAGIFVLNTLTSCPKLDTDGTGRLSPQKSVNASSQPSLLLLARAVRFLSTPGLSPNERGAPCPPPPPAFQSQRPGG